MRAAGPLCLLVLVALVSAAAGLPGGSSSFTEVAELELKKKAAVAAEDYDLAKSLKKQIEKLQTPPPPPPPEPTEEEKHAKRVKAVRSGITTSRDKDHGGDTHAMFATLDHDESGHLSDEEMYGLVGVPKGHKRPEGGGGMFKILDGVVEGMKKSMDVDDDGVVTKAEFHGLLHPEL